MNLNPFFNCHYAAYFANKYFIFFYAASVILEYVDMHNLEVFHILNQFDNN